MTDDAFVPTESAYLEARSILEHLARAGASRRAFSDPPTSSLPEAEEDLSPLVSTTPLPNLSEQTLRTLLESLPDALVLIDRDGVIVMVNEKTESMFGGYKHEELLGRKIEILIPERYRKGHRDERTGYFDKPRSRAMGARRNLFGRRKDGSEFPVEISLSPLATEQSVFATAVIRDVSQRKREEAKFRSLVENIPAVTFVAPLDESARSSTSARRSRRCSVSPRRNGWKTPSSGIGNCTRRTANAGTASLPPPASAVSRFVTSTASWPRTAIPSGSTARPAWCATQTGRCRSSRGWPSTSLRSRRRRKNESAFLTCHRPVLRGGLRRLFQARQSGVHAHARFQRRRVAPPAAHLLRPSRGPGSDPGGDSPPGRRRGDDQLREPLSLQGWHVPVAAMGRHPVSGQAGDLRGGARRHRAETLRSGAGAARRGADQGVEQGPQRGGTRQPGEKRIPGEHEPRDPHTHERHHRVHGTHARDSPGA